MQRILLCYHGDNWQDLPLHHRQRFFQIATRTPVVYLDAGSDGFARVTKRCAGDRVIVVRGLVSTMRVCERVGMKRLMERIAARCLRGIVWRDELSVLWTTVRTPGPHLYVPHDLLVYDAAEATPIERQAMAA